MLCVTPVWALDTEKFNMSKERPKLMPNYETELDGLIEAVPFSRALKALPFTITDNEIMVAGSAEQVLERIVAGLATTELTLNTVTGSAAWSQPLYVRENPRIMWI